MADEDLAFDAIAYIFGNGRTKHNVKISTEPGGSFDTRDLAEIPEYIQSNYGQEDKFVVLSLTTVAPQTGGQPMEMAGVSAELGSLDTVLAPSIVLSKGDRRIGVWLFRPPLDVSSGEPPDGLLALAPKLGAGDYLGSALFDWFSIPLPGYGGWKSDTNLLGEPLTYSMEQMLEAFVGHTKKEITPEEESKENNSLFIYGDPIPSDIGDRQVELGFSSKGKDTYKNGWKNSATTISGLISLLSNHRVGKKDGACILQGGLVGNERRANAMKHMDIVMLDLDTGQDIETIRKRIQELGYLCVIYTTHSHLSKTTDINKDRLVKFIGGGEPTVEDACRYLSEERRYQSDILEHAEVLGTIHAPDGVVIRIGHKPMPKLRLVFFLSQRIVVAERLPIQKDVIEEWKEKYAGLAGMIGAYFDRSCVDPSRLMYLPRHQNGSEYRVELITGNLLDYDSIPRVPLRTQSSARKEADNPFEAVARDMGVGKQTETDSLMWFVAKYGKVFEADEFLLEVDPDGDRGPRSSGPGRTHRCPNDSAHSDAGNEEDKGFFCVNATEGEGFAMKCMHDSCSEIDRVGFLDIACRNADIKSATELTKFCAELVEEGKPEEKRTEETKPIPFETSGQAKEAISEIKKGDDSSTLALVRRIQATRFSPGQRKSLLDQLAKQSGMGVRALSAEAKTVEEVTGSGLDDDLVTLLTGMNNSYAVALIGGKTRILQEPDVDGEQPEFLDVESFRVLLAPKKVVIEDAEGNKKKKALTELWLDWDDRRTYKKGVTFEPGLKNNDVYNLWKGFKTKPRIGEHNSWDLMKAHVYDNVCQGNLENFNWLMTWIAQIYQQPGVKLGSSVALKGKKGTGKSILSDWLAYTMGVHALKVSQKQQIVGNFNAHQMGKVLLVCEEAFWAGDPQSGGILKDLITSNVMMLERKGVDAIMMPNYCRLWMNSNEQWIVPAGLEGERRFFVIECGEDHWQDIDYFEAIRKQMQAGGAEAMVHDLMQWSPKTDKGWNILRKPPATPWLIDQMMETLDPSDRFFMRFVDDGYVSDVNAPLGCDHLVLSLDETNFIPYEGLRWHYEQFMMGSYARRHTKNDKFFQEKAKFWLKVKPEMVMRNINGDHRRCFEAPDLEDIREAIMRRGIQLTKTHTEA